jgi:subtilisin-like proprotein convertase family protein
METFPRGATVTQSIPFTVPADAACGSQIAVPVNISSSLGSVARTFNLQIGRPIVSISATYSSGSLATPIPDLGSVEIPINVSDVGSIEDIDVRVRLNHSFDGDLIISLIAPDGSTVILSANRGGAGDNFGSGANDCSGTSTEFDDAAATAIGAATAPFAGTFRPDSPLSAFNGKATNGTWRLFVVDDAPSDAGNISGGWALKITTSAASCDACPCVLTCPSDVVVPANLDLCAATVGYPAPTFTGGCGTVTCSPPSGSLFPVGTTTVTCSTPEDSCSFTVTVPDAEAPVIASPSNVTVPESAPGAVSAAQLATNAEANRRKPRADPLFDENP